MKKGESRLKLCVISNTLVAAMLMHPGGIAVCGGGVNCIRANKRVAVQ
jgi:hypothetical protein